MISETIIKELLQTKSIDEFKQDCITNGNPKIKDSGIEVCNHFASLMNESYNPKDPFEDGDLRHKK